MRIIRQSGLVETPWKNGGGITRDIAVEMLDGSMLWRLSMADVAVEGPFSSFPGLTRVLTVIRGGGLILHGPDRDLRGDYAKPVVFDGATAIDAELTEGPLRDFNLMYDTVRCDADVGVVHGPAETTADADGQTFVHHCIAGKAKLGGADPLEAGDTAIVTGTPVWLTLDPGDIVLSVGLRIRA